MSTLADRWPYLLLLVAMWVLIRWGMPMSAWVRRRRLRTIARRNWRRGGSSEQHGMDRGDSPEGLLEYGRWLASWREDLIAQGIDPAELAVPLAPPEEPNTDRGDK